MGLTVRLQSDNEHFEGLRYQATLYDGIHNAKYEFHSDPALALFWAIYSVMEGKTNDTG